jgi:ethanolamine ammonia-lyase small subunit
MSDAQYQPQPAHPLTALKRFTNARIALGRTGVSQPVKIHLQFQLAHALAKDAVNIPLDFTDLQNRLAEQNYPSLLLQTQAENKQSYLQRPDLGRLLDELSQCKITQLKQQSPTPDIALVVADGLSSKAIANHALPLLKLLIPELEHAGCSWSPIGLVKHGRVAIGDPIGELYSATMVVVLIGERPGLSSPDSLGIYFTYNPRTGVTDAERNCISNIHQHGLSYQAAIKKLLFLINAAKRLKISGIHLKDLTQTATALQEQQKHSNFLLE